MRLLVLSPNRAFVIAALDASDLAGALAAPAWAACPLVWTDALGVEGQAPPEGCTDVDRANPVLPTDANTPAVTVVAKVMFYRRCSNDEAVAIDQAFAAQTVRLRRIFDAAQTFRSDAEEWPLLVEAATQLFGAARAGELLAPTT